MTCRVLHVADFSAPYPGAFIRQLRMLADEISARGEGTVAFAFPQRAAGAAWLDDLRAAGHEITLLPEPSLRRPRRAARALRTTFDALQPQIIHSHFGGYDIPTALAMPHRLRRVDGDPRLIWHYRTALEEDIEHRSVMRRLKDLVRYRIAGRGVSLAVGVTEALGREAAIRGMGSRACAVVAGCDTDRFAVANDVRERVRRALGIGDDEILLLHLGWHWQRKGGDLLAAATRTLRADGIQVRAMSVGAPEEELESPVERIPFTDAIHEIHAAADIFISASRSEGFGNGLVEAMAASRVAVAALVSGQAEIFDGLDGVAAVEPGDAGAIAAGVIALIERRDEWSAMGAANRAHIVQNFSMRRWAVEMADAYAMADEWRPRHRSERAA